MWTRTSVLSLVVLGASWVTCEEQQPTPLFFETFESLSTDQLAHWIKSGHEKYASQSIAVTPSHIEVEGFENDVALVLSKPAQHYGISTKLKEPLLLDGQPGKKEMVIQYEVRLQDGMECGGAYLKLLDADVSSDLSLLTNESPYVIMFGPDKCGTEKKVHFIVRHQNPDTKTWEEKHLAERPHPKIDRKTHLYTLVIRDDEKNSFEIFIDQESVAQGSMLSSVDFEPPFTPPKRIPDPTDLKPEDWVDEAEIDDPEATKPEDWNEDEPLEIVDTTASMPLGWRTDWEMMIPDPKAKKPEDWDDEDDGDWEAPLVDNPACDTVPGCGEWTQPMMRNPAYKGKWFPPKIPNPEFKGEWKAKEIDNPEYYVEEHPARMHPIGAVAVEIWTMSGGVAFDNIWIGYDLSKAIEYGKATWAKRKHLEIERDFEYNDEEEENYLQMLDEMGGVQNKIELYRIKFQKAIAKNPIVASIFGTVLVVFLIRLCLLLRGKKRPATKEKTDDDTNAKDTTTLKGSRATDPVKTDSDDKSSQVRQRKKIPKAE